MSIKNEWKNYSNGDGSNNGGYKFINKYCGYGIRANTP